MRHHGIGADDDGEIRPPEIGPWGELLRAEQDFAGLEIGSSVFGIDAAAWRDELKLHSVLFEQLAYHLPEALRSTQASIQARLSAA